MEGGEGGVRAGERVPPPPGHGGVQELFRIVGPPLTSVIVSIDVIDFYDFKA